MNCTNLQFPLGANFFFPGLVLPTNFKYPLSTQSVGVAAVRRCEIHATHAAASLRYEWQKLGFLKANFCHLSIIVNI